MYNLMSLILGFLAWIFGGTAVLRGKFSVCSFASLGLCGFSMVLQFYEVSRRVGLEDWSALMDTDGVVTFAANVLLTVTLVLNAAALAIHLLRERKSGTAK